MADACTPVNNKATPVAAIQLASDHPSHAAAEPQLRLSPPLPPTEEPKRDDTDAEAVEAEARFAARWSASLGTYVRARAASSL